jgi:5-methylcytosine-specific restriction endonuclease McrA
VRKRAAEWYLANRDRRRAANKAYRERNRDSCRKWGREYAARNREVCAEKLAEWRRKNPEASREQVRSRRARAQPIPIEQIEWRFAVFGNRCAYCESAGPLSADHVIALARGGMNIPANIRPACRRCNSSKGAAPLREWLARKNANGTSAKFTGDD